MSFRYRALVLAGIVLLVSAGCSSGRENRGRTPTKPTSEEDKKLISAAKDGNVQQMEAAIQSGADVNALDLQMGTPLGEASSRGGLEAVRLLIDKGVDVNGTDRHGISPLQSAILNPDTDIVRLLLSKGADVNAVFVDVVNGRETRVTALMLAKGIGHKEIIDLLIEAGGKE